MAVENEWKKMVPPPSRKALILLITSPSENQETKESPPKQVRYKKPIRAAVRVGTTQMGFVLPHLRTTVLCTSILSISYK